MYSPNTFSFYLLLQHNEDGNIVRDRSAQQSNSSKDGFRALTPSSRITKTEDEQREKEHRDHREPHYELRIELVRIELILYSFIKPT